MKIKELTITQEELNTAVQAYLTTRGICIPVEDVKKKYSYDDDYTVTLTTEPTQVSAVRAVPVVDEPTIPVV